MKRPATAFGVNGAAIPLESGHPEKSGAQLLKNICIFCGSNSGAGSGYIEAAQGMVRAIADAGIASHEVEGGLHRFGTEGSHVVLSHGLTPVLSKGVGWHPPGLNLYLLLIALLVGQITC